MTLDRRHLLGLAPLGLAAMTLSVNAAEFGLAPGDADQTAALQRALDACARSGATLVLPPGSFVAGGLKAQSVRIAGSGASALVQAGNAPLLTVESQGIEIGKYVDCRLTDLNVVGSQNALAQTPLIYALGMTVLIRDCAISNVKGSALRLSRCWGSVENTSLFEVAGNGLEAPAAGGLRILCCRAQRIGGTAFDVYALGGETFVSGNRVENCRVGIAVRGPALVTGNAVSQAQFAGLLLGDEAGSGTIHASNNMLRACGIGIGIAAKGDDIVVGMNTVVGAREGGIRAVSGGKATGRDISQGGSEAYLNLTAFANVVR